MTPRDRLKNELEIAGSKDLLDSFHEERQAAQTFPQRLTTVHPMLAMPPKTYSLVPLDDSYFDYTTSWDLIDWLSHHMELILPLFVHAYDYPWPDGRGFTTFNLAGPWFDDTFNKKSYSYDDDPEKLRLRYDIVKAFKDAFNKMLLALEAKYDGVIHYVNLRETLKTKDEWMNELYPKKEGCGKLANKINLMLHMVLK